MRDFTRLRLAGLLMALGGCQPEVDTAAQATSQGGPSVPALNPAASNPHGTDVRRRDREIAFPGRVGAQASMAPGPHVTLHKRAPAPTYRLGQVRWHQPMVSR